MPPDYWKIEKQHFICSNLTLFIVPFFFFFSFFLFSFSFFFFYFLFFLFFLFPWEGDGPPAPQMTPLLTYPWIFSIQAANTAISFHHSHIFPKSSIPYPYTSPHHLHISTGRHSIIYTLHSRCPNYLNLPCYTTLLTFLIPKRLYKSPLHFPPFNNPHIHLTITCSALSRQCRFTAFIAHVSVPYINTLWTQALYIYIRR